MRIKFVIWTNRVSYNITLLLMRLRPTLKAIMEKSKSRFGLLEIFRVFLAMQGGRISSRQLLDHAIKQRNLDLAEHAVRHPLRI